MWKRGGDMATNRDEQMRRQALHIVFAALHREGRSDLWLAQQIGINKGRLWNYKSGKNRVPEWIVERATTLVNEQIEHVYRIAPREILIQRQGEWRGRKPSSRKAVSHDPSERNTSNSESVQSRSSRHAQPATPTAADTPVQRRQPTQPTQRQHRRPVARSAASQANDAPASAV
jgi:hypothetical protein